MLHGVADRKDMIRKMKRRLVIDPSTTAIIAIDMHRGHMDPEVATMPLSPDESVRVLSNARKLFNIARRHRIPIIQVILQHRLIPGIGTEANANPFWTAVEAANESLTPGRPSTTLRHNIQGSVQTQIMPDVTPEPNDYVINSKRRLSAFYGTDLEILLRALGIETTVFVGVNTNTCVLCSAFEAFNRDFKVIIISDCVASMYGNDLHIFGLENISRCLGWVLDISEFEAKVRGM